MRATLPAFWIGTYERAGGRGLYPLCLTNDGVLLAGSPETGIANASFALWHDHLPVAWFVDERDDGAVSAWHLGESAWQPMGSIPSGGSLPCYLARHRGSELLAVANYGDSAIQLIATDPLTGKLAESRGVARQFGRGPDADRQDGAHAHCVTFSHDGSRLFHVDLGLDRVFCHAIEDRQLGRAKTVFQAPPGWGPRHLAFLADGVHALLVCEMAARCILLEWRGSRFEQRDTVALAPPHRGCSSLGGHLEIIGHNAALVTVRGSDVVTLLRLTDGRLMRVSLTESGGKSPRHLAVARPRLIVAHEEGGGVTAIPWPGDVTVVSEVDIPGAVFVLSGVEASRR